LTVASFRFFDDDKLTLSLASFFAKISAAQFK
jgi:hypothetical protein